MLSSVKLGIDRPDSGADHRHRGAQASQQDGDQRIFQPREEYPDLDNSNRHSGDWRPEAEKEKHARDSPNQMEEIRLQCSRSQKRGDPEIEEGYTRQNSLNQKTEAWPALRECGKKALQEYSPRLRLGDTRIGRNLPKQGLGILLLVSAEVDNAALQPDCDGMSPVIRAKLG